MRAVVQRVLEADVEINGQSVAKIGSGLLVYISVGKIDMEKDAEWIADKIVNLRIFQDEAGKMNRSLLDVGGSILLVSNFYASRRLSKRPSAWF